MIGRINEQWMINARSNESEDSTLADWIRSALNLAAEVDDDGAVWVGRWLSQPEIDDLCKRIDRGV
tara:strand:+ start:621 stop:818 length:198 start_codon:yes stop_codon:yes gene_type:complete